jgi:hypothetical protein
MTERQIGCFFKARVISHKTSLYLNGVVGVDGWANFAAALKAYADCRPATISCGTIPDAVNLMLMGYALEDLAKCIIAYKAYTSAITDVTPFEEKIEEFWVTLKNGNRCKLKTHDLDKLYLARDIGFEVNDTEIDHLRVISIYTRWKGRYPVPLDIDEVLSSEPSFEDLSRTATSIYDRAKSEVERLRSLRS